MNNRIYVFSQGGGGKRTVGQASGISGMRCEFWSQSTGPSGTQSQLTPTDYLEITSISAGDIVTAVSASGKTYQDYCHATFVKSSDTVLNDTTAWPDKSSHFPYR